MPSETPKRGWESVVDVQGGGFDDGVICPGERANLSVGGCLR